MPEEGLIFDPEQASKGSYKMVKRFNGDLVKLAREEGKFDKDQAVLYFENVEIEEMLEDEEKPTLDDDTYRAWYSYALPGKKPHQNSLWIMGVIASAKECGILEQVIKLFEGTGDPIHVTMEKREINLYQIRNDAGEKEWRTGTNFIFVGGTAVTEDDVKDTIKEIVVGLGESAAMRELMMNPKAKRHPEYAEALENGTLADKLGIKLVDGVFKEAK